MCLRSIPRCTSSKVTLIIFFTKLNPACSHRYCFSFSLQMSLNFRTTNIDCFVPGCQNVLLILPDLGVESFTFLPRGQNSLHECLFLLVCPLFDEHISLWRRHCTSWSIFSLAVRLYWRWNIHTLSFKMRWPRQFFQRRRRPFFLCLIIISWCAFSIFDNQFILLWLAKPELLHVISRWVGICYSCRWLFLLICFTGHPHAWRSFKLFQALHFPDLTLRLIWGVTAWEHLNELGLFCSVIFWWFMHFVFYQTKLFPWFSTEMCNLSAMG